MWTCLYGRIASSTAFAVALSSWPKAMAVGPVEQRVERGPEVVGRGDPHQSFLTTR